MGHVRKQVKLFKEELGKCPVADSVSPDPTITCSKPSGVKLQDEKRGIILGRGEYPQHKCVNLIQITEPKLSIQRNDPSFGEHR